MKVRLEDKSEWLKVFDPRDNTISVSLSPPPQVGGRLRVDISVGDNGPRVIVRGKVVSRREAPDGLGPPSCSIALGSEEREKVNYLNGFVRGGLLNLRERRRIPVRLPVTYGGMQGPYKTFTRDINEVGAFVVSEDPLPEDTELHLLLIFPWTSEARSLTGVVSHTVLIEDEDTPGMGVVFRFAEGEAEAFLQDIDQLESLFVQGNLPEDALI